MTMKNLLVLSTALLALVSIDASASKLTLSEAFELGSFASNNKTLDETIGISTVAVPAQTNDTRNAVIDLQAAKLKLIGSADAIIQNITKSSLAVNGISATLIDGIDYVDRQVGSETAYNMVIARLVSAQIGNGIGILAAGDGATPGQFTSVPGGADPTPVLEAIDTTPGNLTPGIRNTVGRMDGLLTAAYRRIIRLANQATADDTVNLAGRTARLARIAFDHGVVAANNILPTEDQFTLAMLVDFLGDVQVEALRVRP